MIPNLIFAASIISGVLGTAMYLRDGKSEKAWLFLMLGELTAFWAMYALLVSV